MSVKAKTLHTFLGDRFQLAWLVCRINHQHILCHYIQTVPNTDNMFPLADTSNVRTAPLKRQLHLWLTFFQWNCTSFSCALKLQPASRHYWHKEKCTRKMVTWMADLYIVICLFLYILLDSSQFSKTELVWTPTVGCHCWSQLQMLVARLPYWSCGFSAFELLSCPEFSL